MLCVRLCGSVALSIAHCRSVALGWPLWVGHCGLVAVGRLLSIPEKNLHGKRLAHGVCRYPKKTYFLRTKCFLCARRCRETENKLVNITDTVWLIQNVLPSVDDLRRYLVYNWLCHATPLSFELLQISLDRMGGAAKVRDSDWRRPVKYLGMRMSM